MPKPLTFSDYLHRAMMVRFKNPEWRVGQTYFNTLYEMRQHLADEIRGTNLDPFYADEQLPFFLAYVEASW